jgi:ketosteroid isomerase-like protein
MPDQIKIEGLFEAIDVKDTDSFLTYLTDDAVFRYGSQDAVKGRAAIGEYVSGFFSTVKALRHTLIEAWEGESSLVCQGEATYTKLDGKEVTLPFVNVFRLESNRIRDYLVHIDPTPLME